MFVLCFFDPDNLMFKNLKSGLNVCLRPNSHRDGRVEVESSTVFARSDSLKRVHSVCASPWLWK